MAGVSFTRRELLKASLLVMGAAMGGAALEFCGVPSRVPPMSKSSGQIPWEAARRILADTAIPTFPATEFMITDKRYGAVGDGTTNNTVAFTRAIEDCSDRGGGHVVVPPGIYSTGAISLLSNVDLHLETGALLAFNGNVEDYPLVLTRYEGIECINHSPMIYAHGQSNIALTGKGTLDASRTRRWNTGSNRASILEPLVAAGLSPEHRVVPRRGQLRSAFIEPIRCSKVLIEGVTLRQSQFWQVHPTLCDSVTIDDVKTRNTSNPNTDGCNPESCDHVVIKNSVFDANDDCIAIKSGRDVDGRRVNAPCQNIVILDCRLQGSAGGIACGSEMSGGIRNLYAYHVHTYGRNVHHMLYVKSNSQRGGYARNLNLDSVSANYLSGAWAFAQMDYEGQKGSYPPMFEDWTIRYAAGDWSPWIFQLSGQDGDAIRRIRVSDSQFTHALLPFNLLMHVTDVHFDRVTINGVEVEGT